MERDLDISIIVASYNPDYKKLFYTLNSAIRQENIKFEIIIADDGSNNFMKESIVTYFRERNFSSYLINALPVNKGTVINVYEAIKKAKGKYIKLISPGDFLYTSNVLQQWKDYMIKCDASLSFSNAIYYQNIDNPEILKGRAIPQNVNTNNKILIKKYLICDDLFLGAATLVEKKIFLKYLDILVGKVKYVEDYSYRLMIADGVKVLYFPYPAILYEYGSGISTSQNKRWNELIRKDFNVVNKMLLEKNLSQKIQRKLKNDLISNPRKREIIRYLNLPILLSVLKKKFFPRYSCMEINMKEFKMIKNIGENNE